MTTRELALLVKDMRSAQKEFAKYWSEHAKKDCERLQCEVDRTISEILRNQQQQGGLLG